MKSRLSLLESRDFFVICFLMDYNKVFDKIQKIIEPLKDTGTVANYIPELGKVDPNKFGVFLSTLEGQHYDLGDANEKFSIQSISKVLALVLAYKKEEENLWNRVGVEPSGTPFNSLLQLENDKGIPRNPLINAGAIVVCDILISHLKNPKKDFIKFVREIAGEPNIDYNKTVAQSEKESGFRNNAMVNYIKSFGNIKNDIEEVMDFYFYQCSIEMTCKELSQAFLFLANDGINPHNQQRIITLSKSKRINAIMQVCGFPGKSGVGGGIVAVHPNKYCIAVWSPRLNSKGNSFKGMKFLEFFTTITESSIF